MESLHLLLLAACALILIVAAWRLLAWRRSRRGLPYTKRNSLLTAGELRCYRVLLQAVPPGMAVFVKVRLMDLVAVPDAAWPTYGAPGSGMHVDFVVVAAATMEPQLAIELDDRSHARPEVRRRDAFKNAALASAGVPLVRVVAAGWYDGAELRARITAALTGDPH